jgi:hypothetical protein
MVSKTINANEPMRLIPVPSALLAYFLRSQEMGQKQPGIGYRGGSSGKAVGFLKGSDVKWRGERHRILSADFGFKKPLGSAEGRVVRGGEECGRASWLCSRNPLGLP